VSWRPAAFCTVLLAYMVGPNPKLGGAQIGDAVLVAFGLVYMATSRLRLRVNLLWLLAWPALVVAISLAGKVFSGFAVGSDETNNLLKVSSLGLIGLLGASSASGAYRQGNEALLPAMVRVVVVGVLFTSALGMIQYARPGLYAMLVHGLYERPLLINISNLQQAELTGRVTSIFTWANAFGAFLVFGLSVLMVNARVLPRSVLLLSVGIGVVCLVLTNSRVSLLLLGVAAVYVAMLNRQWKWLLVGAVVAGVVVAAVPIVDLLGSRNASRFEEVWDFARHGTLPYNVQLRLAVLSYLPQKLLTSEYVYFGFPMAFYQTSVLLSADNQYLGFLLRYGLVALLLVVWQLLATGIPAVMLRRRPALSTEARRYLHTLVLLNILVALGGLSQDTLFIERWREFYFALTGAVLGYVLTAPTERDQRATVEAEELGV